MASLNYLLPRSYGLCRVNIKVLAVIKSCRSSMLLIHETVGLD